MPSSPPLDVAAAAEIESYVARWGWDARPALFALVNTAQFATEQPATASRLGVGEASAEALTPIEQDEVPEGNLDDLLGGSRGLTPWWAAA